MDYGEPLGSASDGMTGYMYHQRSHQIFPEPQGCFPKN